MQHTIKVLIADDREMAREGLRRLLEDAPDISVIGEGRTIYESIRLIRQLHPDVALMDLKWSGDESTGTSAIEYIRQEIPDIRIIAITVYDDLIPEARKAGAHLAITKDFTRDQLQAHIRELHCAEILPSVRTAKLPEEPLVEPLTEREREVLCLLAEGMRDREIAKRLIIAESTAKNHVASILGKLGAKNRTQAVIIALRQGHLDGLGTDSHDARR